MIQLYHNPRCQKSREALQLLKESKKEFEIVLYLKNPPSEKELAMIVAKLKLPAIDLVRKNELLWKEHYNDKKLTSTAIIKAMVTHPKLIERPLVIDGEKAILGRPPEKIKEIL